MKVIIKWTYSFKRYPTTVFVSETMTAGEAVVIAEDLEKTGRLKELEFEDETGVVWSKKELKKLLVEIEDEPQDVTVYFDGGYQKAEGTAGVGVAIYYSQGNDTYRIRANKLLQQLDSNNEAEYAAFYEALNQLEELGVHHQTCLFKGDSQVVLNQLSGDWPCYEENFIKWLDRIEAKMKKLNIRPSYQPILRKENQEADKLAAQAMKQEVIYSKLKI